MANSIIPTRKRIVDCIRWLVETCICLCLIANSITWFLPANPRGVYEVYREFFSPLRHPTNGWLFLKRNPTKGPFHKCSQFVICSIYCACMALSSVWIGVSLTEHFLYSPPKRAPMGALSRDKSHNLNFHCVFGILYIKKEQNIGTNYVGSLRNWSICLILTILMLN